MGFNILNYKMEGSQKDDSNHILKDIEKTGIRFRCFFCGSSVLFIIFHWHFISHHLFTLDVSQMK